MRFSFSFRLIRMASARDWVSLFFQALLGIALFRMFLLFGLEHTTAAEAGILIGTTPAITAVLAWLLLKETMRANHIFGIASTVAGVLLIQNLFMPGLTFLPDHLIGNLLVLCAAACESLFNVSSRFAVVSARSAEQHVMPSISRTAIVCLIALMLCIVPACLERPAGSLAALGWREWLTLIWYGVFVTAVSYLLWYKGISRCMASTAAAFSGMMPFTSMVLAVLILGEQASVLQWCGGLLVIFGMVLIGRAKE